MIDVKQKKRAAIHANMDFICVQTYSGYGSASIDPAGVRIFLENAPSATALGQALLEALSKSRILKPKEIEEFFDPANTAKNYEDWVDQVMQKFCYSKRRDMFKGLKYCTVTSDGGLISIGPSKRGRGEAWLGLGKDEHVRVADSASADEIGNAVQLALERCLV